MFDFTDDRYNRQVAMPEWGARQEYLSSSKVAVIGAGGVKSTLLMALAAAGVGHIRVIDFDKVELSNLNRQTLYGTEDIGHFKAERAVKRLNGINPEITVEPVLQKVESDNICDLLDDFPFVVEGGDSPAARNLINTYCLEKRKPYVHASAQFSYGYVLSVVPNQITACFACFFPQDHSRTITTGPVPVNVLSVQLAGTLGAAEVLKWFLGYRDNMIINKRLCFSSLLLSENFEYMDQPRIPNCPVCSVYYNK